MGLDNDAMAVPTHLVGDALSLNADKVAQRAGEDDGLPIEQAVLRYVVYGGRSTPSTSGEHLRDGPRTAPGCCLVAPGPSDRDGSMTSGTPQQRPVSTAIWI